jgi:hypothetical protein
MMRQAADLTNFVWQVIRYPLQLEPMHKLKYFEEREKFDITVYLKNPMVLMGLMMAFMAFVMPKMVSALLRLAMLRRLLPFMLAEQGQARTLGDISLRVGISSPSAPLVLPVKEGTSRKITTA